MTAAEKILVVDDEPPIRKLLRMGLAAHGYEVLEATNGKSALELLDKKPDLVILDLGLPDIDGLELLRRIRHAQESLPSSCSRAAATRPAKLPPSIWGPMNVTTPLGMDRCLRACERALRHQLQVHGERPVFHVGTLSVDLVRGIVDKEVELHAQGVRPAAPARAARRQGAHPQVPAARALGRAHRHAISARLRAPAAAQDRETTPAPIS